MVHFLPVLSCRYTVSLSVHAHPHPCFIFSISQIEKSIFLHIYKKEKKWIFSQFLFIFQTQRLICEQQIIKLFILFSFSNCNRIFHISISPSSLIFNQPASSIFDNVNPVAVECKAMNHRISLVYSFVSSSQCAASILFNFCGVLILTRKNNANFNSVSPPKIINTFLYSHKY